MNQETHFQPQLSQQQLAEMIDREGLAFEMADPQTGEWMNSVYATKGAMWWIKQGGQIRLAPGVLTEFLLRPGDVPHNPSGLAPERITKGGKYRAVTVEELDGRFGLDKLNCAEVFNAGIWFPALSGTAIKDTIRVPVNTPFPHINPGTETAYDISCCVCGVKANGFHEGSWLCYKHYDEARQRVPESSEETPRTDAELRINKAKARYGNVWVRDEFARQLERELNAALAENAKLKAKIAELGKGGGAH